ncbi:MAG TPA: hypothetical protein VGK59_07970 [Ohtaekwangia sp.]
MSHRVIATVGIMLAFWLAWFNVQGQVTMDEFIRSAMTDPEIKTFDEQISYLERKPYRLSPLQKFEFRTQTRELQVNQQEYALRFTPANPWEIRSNNRYFKAYQSSLQFERDIILKEALVERYYQTIYIVYYSGLKSQLEEIRKLVDNQVAILEKQQTSSFFDADDYVELKMKQLNRMVEFEEADFELHNEMQRIERLYPEAHGRTIDWNPDAVISVERIENIVDSLTQAALVSAAVEYQKQKIEMANQEYKLEKANINLGFLQTEFDQRRVEQDRSPINLSFGVTIPITNPNKGDMAKRRLESIEAEYDLKEAEHESQTDKTIIRENLRKLVERHSSLQQKISQLEQSNLIQSLSTLKGGDPLIITQYREDVGKLKTLLLKLKRDIYFVYIEYLSLADHLQQQPLVNYLAKDLGVID